MAAVSTRSPGDRAWYEARLERVRLRAMLAIELGGAPRDGVRAALERELAAVDAALAVPSRREQHLRTALGLGDDDVDLLWTAVAVAHDPRVLAHAQVLAGTEARRGASVALHAQIAGLDGARARSLALAAGPSHPLLRHHLLIAVDDGEGVARRLAVPHRVAAFLAGDDAVDAEVADAGGRVAVPPEPLWDPPQQRALERIGQVLASREPVVLVVEGPVGAGRRTAIAAQGPTTCVDARRVPPAALERVLAALHRESVLSATTPVVADIDDLVDAEPGAGPRLRLLAMALDRAPGPVAVISSVPGLEIPTQRRILRVPFPAPDTATRRALWARTPEVAALELDGIALRYRLGAGGIARAAASARNLAEARGDALTVHDVVAGVRNDIADRLGGLAQRVDTHQSWDDLVLGADTLDQVRALSARVRLAHQVLERWGFAAKLARGIGVASLFTGPPGTGKTMVAGLIARELDLELYQVDLSKVVSKWVGETEKQLARIFAAAEAGHALLLFDEADSLFAKRTEVKAAIDRYANLEVNYLLQRIEAFGGITILTTNMDASIDPALRRRLASHITFWPPDDKERQLLWRRMLATDAPIDGAVDVEALSLAFPDMTGANIRNAAIAAAFLAASEGSPITQSHLERAGRGEYRAMGRVLGS